MHISRNVAIYPDITCLLLLPKKKQKKHPLGGSLGCCGSHTWYLGACGHRFTIASSQIVEAFVGKKSDQDAHADVWLSAGAAPWDFEKSAQQTRVDFGVFLTNILECNWQKLCFLATGKLFHVSLGKVSEKQSLKSMERNQTWTNSLNFQIFIQDWFQGFFLQAVFFSQFTSKTCLTGQRVIPFPPFPAGHPWAWKDTSSGSFNPDGAAWPISTWGGFWIMAIQPTPPPLTYPPPNG